MFIRKWNCVEVMNFGGFKGVCISVTNKLDIYASWGVTEKRDIGIIIGDAEHNTGRVCINMTVHCYSRKLVIGFEYMKEGVV